MRATLAIGLLLVAFAVAVVLGTRTQGSFLAEWLRRPERVSSAMAALPEPVAPEASDAAPQAPEPTDTPATREEPTVITAGEVSVLEADAPEPMVRYVDSGGSIRMVRGLANVPGAYRARAVVLQPDKVNVVDVPVPVAAAFRDWQPEPNRNRHDVVLFSAPWCGACESARRYLDQQNIRYEERDIEADESAKQDLFRILNRIAIPLLEVDGRYISGFRPDVYERALR